MKAGQCFGNLKHTASGTEWKPRDATSYQDTICIKIQASEFDKVMKDLQNKGLNEQTTNFIIQTVPGLKYMNNHAVKRISNYFREKRFTAGEFLFFEGVAADRAYIIREGTCKLIKHRGEM